MLKEAKRIPEEILGKVSIAVSVGYGREGMWGAPQKSGGLSIGVSMAVDVVGHL